MAINKITGLPELPEGYFFRVRQDWAKDYYWVQIRRGVSIFSYCVKKTNFTYLDSETIERQARYVHRRFLEDVEQKLARKELFGDYPPKTLNGK